MFFVFCFKLQSSALCLVCNQRLSYVKCQMHFFQLIFTHVFASSGAVQSPHYPGDPMSPFSPKSPNSPNSPSRTLPRNFKSYHEASGINALMEQPSRYSMGGSHTLPKNYKSPVTSPLGSPTTTRDPLIDLPVS